MLFAHTLVTYLYNRPISENALISGCTKGVDLCVVYVRIVNRSYLKNALDAHKPTWDVLFTEAAEGQNILAVAGEAGIYVMLFFSARFAISAENKKRTDLTAEYTEKTF